MSHFDDFMNKLSGQEFNTSKDALAYLNKYRVSMNASELGEALSVSAALMYKSLVVDLLKRAQGMMASHPNIVEELRMYIYYGIKSAQKNLHTTGNQTYAEIIDLLTSALPRDYTFEPSAKLISPGGGTSWK